MKVSVNWIRDINKKYHCSADPMPDGIDVLVEKIGAQLGAVEEVIDLGRKYEGVMVAKIVRCEKHPNADKLSVCLIDPGGIEFDKSNSSTQSGIPQGQPRGTSPKAIGKAGSTRVDDSDKFRKYRNKDGLVEVICGAPNVTTGQLVAWIPPGVTVPSTVDKEPFVLEAREIRGVVSNGMIASLKEQDVGDDHSGILVIDQPAKPGQPLSEVYDLDDYVIDIENKMFTHRPDLFGHLGVTREIAGIQGHVFKSPSWYQENPPLPKPSGPPTHKLVVKNAMSKLVPRFSAAVLKDIKVGPSPVWLKVRLASVGIKSINNIVDITNYLMLETAQPLHAYDYDKLGGSIETRLGRDGEELKIIGGKIIKLTKDDIVITSHDKPIGLGGVMGGADTEVTEGTTNIALEVANFDMNTIRKSAMHHGLFTEAATRFTKNQNPRQNLAVLVKAIEQIKQLAGGRQASPVIDNKHFKPSDQTVNLSTQFINERLGLDLPPAKIKKILENVEFAVTISGDKLSIRPPFWRTDIEIPEDIVEEVGRLYGYDHLPLVLPRRDLTPAKLNEALAFKSKIRQILSAAGANEVLTYSFVHGSLIENSGQDVKDAYHIKNALSPDFQYYRLSLTPSLLEKVHPNIKEGFNNFVLFELGRTHIKGVLDREKLPAELDRLSMVLAKKRTSKEEGTPFFVAKKQLEYLLQEVGVATLTYKPLGDKLDKQWAVAAQSYEPKRSAVVYCKDQVVGLLGEPTAALKQALKLPSFTAQAEVDTELLLANSQPPKYSPLNKFPAVEQDLCLRTSVGIAYGELTDFVLKILGKISAEHGYKYGLSPVDIYQRPEDKAHKQTTWHITLAHPGKTLTSAEANKVLDKIASESKSKFKAEKI